MLEKGGDRDELVVGTRYRLHVEWDRRHVLIDGRFLGMTNDLNRFDADPPVLDAETREEVPMDAPFGGELYLSKEQILGTEPL